MNSIKNITGRSAAKFISMILSLCLLALPIKSFAEDIDIFINPSTGTGANSRPNVLIVLDNTSNWSRNDQNWPGGVKQGQAELLALKNVIAGLDDSVNVGLMMFTDNGSGREGGYVRSAIRQMTAENKVAFTTLLQTIYNNFGDPSEKSASNANYSNVLFDVFKYFGGYTSPAHATDGVAGTPLDATHFGPSVFATTSNIPSANVDLAGYTSSALTTYVSPISSDNNCAKDYVIFIGNGFPNADDISYLQGVAGNTSQLRLPEFTTTTSTTPTNLGYTSACYQNLKSCSTSDYATQCTNYGSCTCGAPTTATGCSNNNEKYSVIGTNTTTTVSPSGTFTLPTANKTRYSDEWSRFLHQTDVSSQAGQQYITSYSIDVFNAKQDADQSALLWSMANAGGGKYFSATNQDAIIKALKEIFVEIQAVNATFASASLPISATNRAQNENQVYIGMFRPDTDAKPRWFGNLKRYQLANFMGSIDLADKNGLQAVNSLTGFVTDCATSYWTSDSATYWQNVSVNPPPIGRCTTSANSIWSDAPDGPFVEKGAIAEVIRKGNNPPNTDSTPTWAVNRTIYKLSSGSLVVDTTTSGVFARGQDKYDENINGNTSDTRPSLHGDVVHGRPLPVNHGSSGIVVYYGSNDGVFHAINAVDGKEKWGFIAPEFEDRLTRLEDNSPLINYPGMTGITPTPKKKDYFFDGSIGIYQNVDNSKVWIYPSMRRGGRKIYALDVSNPSSPIFKWAKGCPNLLDDTGCDNDDNGDFRGVGQTWSMPQVAFIKGYGSTTPVIIMGGGYDDCEDADGIPTCSSPKGANIYVLDAFSGEQLASFATTRSVAADVSLVDIDRDGFVDYAYAADTGGNLYRVDFITPSTKAVLAKADWSMHRIAYTNGANRKFLFAPTVLANNGKVFVALGSGDREHPLITNFPYTNPVTNRFYVLLDDPVVTATIDMDSTDNFADFTTATTCDTPGILPAGTGKKGWFMSFPADRQGEQTVTSALIVSGMLTFSTNRPVPPTANQCGGDLGEARGYWLNLLNASGGIGDNLSCGGDRSTTFVGGGLPPSPVLGIVTIDNKPTPVLIGAVKRDGTGANSPIGGQKVIPVISSKRKRVYWNSSIDK